MASGRALVTWKLAAGPFVSGRAASYHPGKPRHLTVPLESVVRVTSVRQPEALPEAEGIINWHATIPTIRACAVHFVCPARAAACATLAMN